MDPNEAMFPNFQLGSENPQNGGNFFMSRQGISTQKTCRTDPNDQNYVICKVKETKLINENGKVNRNSLFFIFFSHFLQDKYVTQEREEREPISQGGAFSFPSFFSNNSRNWFEKGFDSSFFGGFPKNQENKQDEAFSQFEKSQHFNDFFSQIKSFFFGNNGKENQDKELEENVVPYKENIFDNFNDFFIFPNFFFSRFPFQDPLMNDPFFKEYPQQGNFYQNNNNPSQFNGEHRNNYINDMNSRQNFQNNRNPSYRPNNNYSFPKFGETKADSSDIYDF